MKAYKSTTQDKAITITNMQIGDFGPTSGQLHLAFNSASYVARDLLLLLKDCNDVINADAENNQPKLSKAIEKMKHRTIKITEAPE